MTKAIDLVGKVFGRLTVVALDKPVNKRRAFLCSCSCGNKKVIRSECLNTGMTLSCGCIRNERIGNLNRTHSMSSTPEYKSWAHAKSRTTNKKDAKYYDYGGRGITMCQEWIESFDAFYADMGPKPSSKHSLGRIDVDKGYCKENCRWENYFQQARARRDNVFVIVNGTKMVFKDACNVKKLDYKTTHYAWKSGKVSLEEIFA